MILLFLNVDNYEECEMRYFFFLKGQVTFLKHCLKVVCMTVIIPRFIIFWLTTVLKPKNAFVSLCSRRHLLLAQACWREHSFGEQGEQIHRSVFRKSPQSRLLYVYTYHAIIFIFHMIIRNKDAFLSAHVITWNFNVSKMYQSDDGARRWILQLFLL